MIDAQALTERAAELLGARCMVGVEAVREGADLYGVFLKADAGSAFRVAEAARLPAVVAELVAEVSRPKAVSQGGLAGDGWWVDETLATQRAARAWVRLVLLGDPHMSDSNCDRFIASLDPPKREDLLRRARGARSAEGF